MKTLSKLITVSMVFIGLFYLSSQSLFAQGNSNGNANSNNNANGNALKWETQGNNADTTDFIGTTNPTALKMRTNNVERLRITKDGKFGIGISNPLEKFELHGNLKLSGDIIFSDYANVNDTTGKFLMVDENGRTNPVTLDQLKNQIYDIERIPCKIQAPFQNPTWANGMNKIFSSCPQVYVGIGTDDPQKMLDVRGRTQTRILEVGREYIPSSLISGFRTGVTSQPLLTLGQYDPQSQMEHKVLEVSSAGEFALNFNSSVQGASEKIFTISNENRKLVYLKASNETLYARRIIVDQQTWSDYVFRDDYELLPLNLVEEFIIKHGHLPNVPNEDEVTEEGVDLAEMNKILLEKVEELTLYTIEQQKEIDRLKEIVNQ